jgi:hypothetical protein
MEYIAYFVEFYLHGKKLQATFGYNLKVMKHLTATERFQWLFLILGGLYFIGRILLAIL